VSCKQGLVGGSVDGSRLTTERLSEHSIIIDLLFS